MKSLILAVVFSLAFGGAAIAKDGPFPMFQALGTWQSKSKDLQVQISLKKFIDQNHVQIQVIARSIETQRVIASGYQTQDLRSSEFEMILIGLGGEKMRLILKPEYKILPNMNKRILELQMDMIDLDSKDASSLPSPLEKIR